MIPRQSTVWAGSYIPYIHDASVDTMISIPFNDPPLMKECVFEYDYSLPTVWSLYSNCYEFYFDEPMDLATYPNTYIGITDCGFYLDKWFRAYEFYGNHDTEHPMGFESFMFQGSLIAGNGKYIDYYTLPGFENRYWYDCYWGMIFPILHPRCTAPKDFRIVYIEERLDTVLWRGDPESDVFQVSVASYPASPDSGMITTVTDTTFVLPHHSIDTLLVAYVRKMCTFEFDTHTDTVWGDWAGPVLVAGDTTGLGGGDTTSHGGDTTGIATADLQQISITPNPATGTVTVRSAEQMTEIEVVDIVGASVLRQQASGLSAKLDVKALPRGTYIVRIHTPRGVTARKLILQ